MATERQVAANRRNARNSRGPRSTAGKKRASRNSYRHGLAAAVTTTEEHAKRIEKLARKIAGKTADVVTLEHARSAAEAEFWLARVWEVKAGLIERVFAFGSIKAATPFNSVGEAIRFLNALGRGTADVPEPIEDATTMPSTESERLAEAVRRALPELLKLDRYEQRAERLREQSLRAIYESKRSPM